MDGQEEGSLIAHATAAMLPTPTGQLNEMSKSSCSVRRWQASQAG